MLPAYRCMDSYPHERNRTPFFQHHHPSFETIPSYMKVEPGKPPLPYESWPYMGNYGYPFPCHACCGHNYFPGYYSFRPPHPRNQSELPFSCMGGYPVFPGSYPAHYAPPYWMEQPRYEYEKDAPKTHHCGGCPNHSDNLKEGKGVKIEEQGPDVQNKGNASLIPTEWKNNPYPIVWIPPGFVRNNDNQIPLESKVKEEDKVPVNAKLPERGAQEPIYGWFPPHLNRLGSLKRGGGDGITQDNQDGEMKNQLPYPIIWMPSSHESEETERKDSGETNNAPKSVEEQPSKLKIIPVKLPYSDNGMNKPDMDRENFDGGKVKDKIHLKEIPVKQMEQHEDKHMDGNGQSSKIPVMPIKNIEQKEPLENGAKRNSSSPKTSKLPPVCLRVDPLPRKKNGNVSSRSPSPPGNRDKSGEASTGTTNVPNLSGSKEKVINNEQVQHCAIDDSEVKSNKNEGTVIDVMQRADQTHQISNEAMQNGSQGQVPTTLSVSSPEDGGTRSVECKMEAIPGEAIKIEKSVNNAEAGGYEYTIEKDGAGEAQQQKLEEDNRANKQSLSTTAAAVIIQSAYRGYEVRKWEPLKKLKQIAEVRDRLAEIRSRVQALESLNLERDNKERAVIGETRMALLLKLDTIQGLHAAIREIRRSVAGELISLQEKLDSLIIKTTEELAEKIPAVDNLCGCTSNDVRSQEGQVKQLEDAGHGCSESNCDNNSSHVADDDCCQGKETLGATLVDDVDAGHAQKGGCDPHLELENSVELQSGIGERINSKMELHENIKMEDSTDLEEKEPMLAIADKAVEVNQLVELPQAVNEEPFLPECEKHEPVEAKETVEPLLSESERHEPVEAKETEVVPDGNLVSHEATDIMLQGKEGSEMNQSEQQLLRAPEGGTVMALEDLVGVRLRKAEEIPGNNESEDLLQQSQTEGVRQLNGVADVSQPEKSQELFRLPVAENHNDEPRGGWENVGVEYALTSASASAGAASEEKEMWSENSKEEGLNKPMNGLEEDKEGKEKTGKDHMPYLETAGFFPTSKDIEVLVMERERDTENQPVATGEEDDELPEGKVETVELQSGIGKNETSLLPKMCKITQVGDTNNLAPLGEEEQQIGPEVDSQELTEGTKMDVRLDKAEATNVLAGTQRGERSPEEERELFPLSFTSNEIPLEEHATGKESSHMLMEENKKLREMMKKMMQDGKEQFSVISNLIGRVKDLERKLQRKKKLRTRRQQQQQQHLNLLVPKH